MGADNFAAHHEGHDLVRPRPQFAIAIAKDEEKRQIFRICTNHHDRKINQLAPHINLSKVPIFVFR